MIKVWFMLVLTSFPNAPSVKYNGFLYASEFECTKAENGLMEVYESKPLDYRLTVKLDTHRVEFESFPIEGLKSDIKA